VIVQAGQSDAGRDLAARTAEVLLLCATAPRRAFYSDRKARVAWALTGISQIMPGVLTVVGRTREGSGKFDWLG
jgi:alkanesulfonate monooxygenase SsuD/methylene tetrahydromethanopterin reductase-like flavin-dependent oxidoreductase (luciferase family)